jgi:hypothetical protein
MAYGSRPRRTGVVLDASGRPSWRSLKAVFDRRAAEDERGSGGWERRWKSF